MSATTAESPSGTILLPQIDTPCMGNLARRQWDRTLAFRTGPWVVGIRSNSSQTTDLIDSHFGALRTPEHDGEVKPNFSVELQTTVADRRRLQIIYRDSEIVGRRRAVEDALDDLSALLDEGPRLGLTDKLVAHAAGVVLPSGRVVLVPGRMMADLLTRRARLESAGLHLLPSRTAVIDPRTGDVLLDLVEPALAALVAAHPLLVGRRPVAAWGVMAGAGDEWNLASAAGVFHVCPTVLNRYPIGLGRTLHWLANVASVMQFVQMPVGGSIRLADTILSLADRLD